MNTVGEIKLRFKSPGRISMGQILPVLNTAVCRNGDVELPFTVLIMAKSAIIFFTQHYIMLILLTNEVFHHCEIQM